MSGETIGRPMEILLVEDSLTQARVAIEALKCGEVKHRLAWVRDGGEALNYLFRVGEFGQAPRPDLILLDLRLPKVDGMEVLSTVKADTDLRKIPVVVMTGSQEEEDKLRCQLLNVDAYITKPVDLEKFLSLVRKLKHFWHKDLILPQV